MKNPRHESGQVDRHICNTHRRRKLRKCPRKHFWCDRCHKECPICASGGKLRYVDKTTPRRNKGGLW